MHVPARHPLRATLAASLAVNASEETPEDLVRQFILGWLGGLVFFGTLFA